MITPIDLKHREIAPLHAPADCLHRPTCLTTKTIVQMPGGRVAPSDGRIALPGGKIALPGGKIALPGGKIALTGGRMMLTIAADTMTYPEDY